MNIYEISSDMLKLQEMLENDPESQYVKDTLEALAGELKLKCGAYCRVIKNMEANLEGYKNEIDRLTKRKKTLENSIQRLKDALLQSMQATGINKIEDDVFTVAVRNNAPKLPSNLDINQVPIDFIIERQYDVDKRGLLQAIKNGEVEGIALEQSQSLRIS